MRVYAGGSWTTYRRAQGVRREEHPPQGEGGLAQAERCPLCRAGRGDGRHVALNCAGPGLPEIRATLFDEAERILREADDPSSLRSVASLRHPRGLRGQGADGAEERWPLLTQLGWLRPTTGEAEICAGLGQRRPAELGYDLGYRGIIPRALAKALGGPNSTQARLLTCRIAEAMVIIRARYLRAIKAEMRSRSADRPPPPPTPEPPAPPRGAGTGSSPGRRTAPPTGGGVHRPHLRRRRSTRGRPRCSEPPVPPPLLPLLLPGSTAGSPRCPAPMPVGRALGRPGHSQPAPGRGLNGQGCAPAGGSTGKGHTVRCGTHDGGHAARRPLSAAR